MNYWVGERITFLPEGWVFVFGSNPEGRHGLGAAKTAMQFGAKYGVGRGRQGNTYALVTKNLKEGFYERSTGITYHTQGYRSVSPEMLSSNIEEFYQHARDNPNNNFAVVYQASSKNLNGYSPKEMFDLFNQFTIPENIYFHESFKQFGG